MQDIFKQILVIARGMWNFRWPALVAAWVISALGVVVVWTIPDRYEAVARVYVDTDSTQVRLSTGNGFATATQNVNVTASFSFNPGSVAFPSGSTQNLSLGLSGTAPAGGPTESTLWQT